MKVTNLVSLDRNTHLQKNIQLFRLLPLRSLQKVYIKGLKPFFLDPKAEKHLTLVPKLLIEPPTPKTNSFMAKPARF
jgi:hypothetical protein